MNIYLINNFKLVKYNRINLSYCNNNMGTIIYLSDDLFINSNLTNLINVQIGTFINTAQINAQRIGFLYTNNNGRLPFGNTHYIDNINIDTINHQIFIYHYFSNEFITLLKKINTYVTVDLITSNLNTPLFLYELNKLKKLLPLITFNYSLTNINDSWKLTTSTDNILALYFKPNINTNLIPPLYIDFFDTFFYIKNGVYVLQPNSTTNILRPEVNYSSTDIVLKQSINLMWKYSSYFFSLPIDISSISQNIDFNNISMTFRPFNNNSFNGLFVGGPSGFNKQPINMLNAKLSLNGSVNSYAGCLWSNYINYSQLSLNFNNCKALIHGTVGQHAGSLIGSFAGSNNGSITISNSIGVIDVDVLEYGGGLVGSFGGINGNITITNSYSIITDNIKDYSGGIVGSNFGINSNLAQISNVYSIIGMSVGINCGGLIGGNNILDQPNCVLLANSYTVIKGTIDFNSYCISGPNVIVIVSGTIGSLTFKANNIILGNCISISSTYCINIENYYYFNSMVLNQLPETSFSRTVSFNLKDKILSTYSETQLPNLLTANTMILMEQYTLFTLTTLTETLTYVIYSGRYYYERNFFYTDFGSCDLSNVSFVNSSLNNASFANANLTNAVFIDCDLTKTNFHDATFNNTVIGPFKSALNPLFDISYTIVKNTTNDKYVIGPGITVQNIVVNPDNLINSGNTGNSGNSGNTGNSNSDSGNQTNISNINSLGWPKNIINPSNYLPNNFSAKTSVTVNSYTVTTGVVLNNVDLSNYDFSNMNLSEVDLTGSNLSNVNLSGSILKNAILDGVNFTNSNLSNVDFTDTHLENTNLTNAVLNNALFVNNNMTDAKIEWNSALNTVFKNIIGSPLILTNKYQLIQGYLLGKNINLTNAVLLSVTLIDIDLSFANMSNITLNGSTLINVTAINANLSNAILTKSTFIDCDFSNSLFKNAQLLNSDINRCNFTNTDLTNSNFSNSLIQNTNMSNSNILNSDFSVCTFNLVKGVNLINNPFNLPEHTSIIQGYLIGPNIDLTDVIIESCNLTNCNLSGANLTGIILKNVDLSCSNLLNAIFISCIFDHVIMNNVIISGTNFTLGTFKFIKSSFITSNTLNTSNITHLPDKWTLNNSYLFGPTAILTNANLLNATIFDVDLTDADLSNAILTNVNSLNVTGLNCALPPNYRLINGYIFGPSISLKPINSSSTQQINCTNINFEITKLYNTTFTSVDFSNCNLSNCILDNASFTDCIFDNTNFGDNYLKNITFQNCNLLKSLFNKLKSDNINGLFLLPSKWKLIDGVLFGPTANLSNKILLNTDLTGIDLYEANFTNASLTHTKISKTILTKTNLTNVASSDLTGIPYNLPINWKLINGYLVGPTANLRGANLMGAKLTGLTLTNANLSGATLTFVISGNVTGPIIFGSNDWKLINGYLIGPKTNLTNENLTNFDLSQTNLNGAILSHCILNGVKSGLIVGTPINLPTNYNYINGFLIGPFVDLSNVSLLNMQMQNLSMVGVNLSNSDLTNSDLFGSNLLEANLFGTILANVNLLSTNLTNVKSGRIIGIPNTLPLNWSLINGYLFGPYADLSNTDLSNFDLSGLNLSNVNLTNAKLNNVILRNTDLSNANFTNSRIYGIIDIPYAIPSKYEIIDGILFGPNVNLSDLNLRSFVFNNTDFTNVNMVNTNFQNAIFNNCSFINTNITNTIFSSSSLINSISYQLIGIPNVLPTDCIIKNSQFVLIA